VSLKPFELRIGSGHKSLVLDANILVRAILGKRVWELLEQYTHRIMFITTAEAFNDARKYVPLILAKRGLKEEQEAYLEALELLSDLVQVIEETTYSDFENEARSRLKDRDEEDWSFVALALKQNCPIWTEDQDFFGSGVATWTTDRVEIYLNA
jgi:predicted nucleic acid-binding protein